LVHALQKRAALATAQFATATGRAQSRNILLASRTPHAKSSKNRNPKNQKATRTLAAPAAGPCLKGRNRPPVRETIRILQVIAVSQAASCKYDLAPSPCALRTGSRDSQTRK